METYDVTFLTPTQDVDFACVMGACEGYCVLLDPSIEFHWNSSKVWVAGSNLREGTEF